MRCVNIFSVLDFMSGYLQAPIPLKKNARKLTAFRTRKGLFRFRILPFGLKNYSVTIIRLMYDIMRDYLNDLVQVYLDYIVIFSKYSQFVNNYANNTIPLTNVY